MMRRSTLWLAVLALGVCAGGVNASAVLAASPSVETLPASSIGEKGATLNGTVNPNGGETKIYFEYGTTESYGSKTTEVNVGSGTTTLEKSQAISGLSANTVYHFRIVASNPSGSSQGSDRTFTTVGAPAVSGLEAEPEITFGEEARLEAWVDPNGQSTTYQFEYGPESKKYTNVVPIPAGSAGSGYQPTHVEVNVTGLTRGTIYYYRVSATNASGKVTSAGEWFPSSFHPNFKMSPASNILRTSAKLNATLSWATKYWFEYGTTESYGSKTSVKELGGEEGVQVSVPISGLKENTLYHYRLVAENVYGTHSSLDQTFTTGKAATLYPKGSFEALKVNANLKAFSPKLTFVEEGIYSHYCEEAEFSGVVEENPGAKQSVSTSRFQTSGGKCMWEETESPYTISYTFLPGAIMIEYAKNGSTGFAETSKLSLRQTVFLGSFKIGECDYDLTLAGPFFTGTSLMLEMTGKTQVVKESGYCPGEESVAAVFAVTSNGTAVEAK